MKRLLCLLLLCRLNAFSQQPAGKWYALSNDMVRILLYEFDSSTQISTRFEWDLKTKTVEEKARILTVRKERGNLYYLLQDAQDSSAVFLSIFASLRPDSSFVQATTSEEHTRFATRQDALHFIEMDSLTRPGLIFYSEKEFARLRALPDASTITRDDYKRYLQALIESRNRFESFASRHKDDFGFMFYLYYLGNQARDILARLGYNPVLDDGTLENTGEQFKDDPALQELMKKALRFD